MELAGDSVIRSPRLAARRREVRSERRRRRRRAVVAVIAALSLAYGAYVMSRSLLFGLTGIEVVGATQIDRHAVVAASGLRLGQPALGIDLDVVAARVRAMPGVRTARVERAGSLEVRIVVTERVPAIALRSGGQTVLLDQDGRPVVGMKPPGRIPVLEVRGHAGLLPSGTTATVMRLWERMPVTMRAGVSRFQVGETGGIEFVLGRTRVVFGGIDRVDEKLGALALVRTRARRDDVRLAIVDLRAPERPAATLR